MGGTGFIGNKLVNVLGRRGHDVVAASLRSGVDAITGEGLDAALQGVDAVVDVLNAPSFEPGAVLKFFETSTRHLLAAEIAAQVKHHVVLSIVGIEGLPDNGYFRAKVAQEALVRASAVPFTIVRATQFFDFIGGFAQPDAKDSIVRPTPALMQPVAADDVVVRDPQAPYFGAVLGLESLVAGEDARLGKTNFADWLRLSVAGG